VVYADQKGQTIVSDAKAPASVHIESSQDSTFTIGDKVASITLLNCSNVVVHFASVISTFEIIKGTNCYVACASSCSTYTIDDSSRISLFFSKETTDDVMWVSTQAQDITLIAATSPSASATASSSPDGKANSDDVSFPIVTPAKAAPEEPKAAEGTDPAAPASSATPQYRTVFTAATAQFVTSLIEREGPLGYIVNR